MTGVYMQWGELRRVALEMAIDSTRAFDATDIVDRAEAYFQFLTAGGPEANLKIPSQKPQGTNFSELS